MKARIMNSTVTMTPLRRRNMKNAAFSAISFRLLLSIWLILLSISIFSPYLFLDEIYSTLVLIISVMKNKTTPNRNSDW